MLRYIAVIILLPSILVAEPPIDWSVVSVSLKNGKHFILEMRDGKIIKRHVKKTYKVKHHIYYTVKVGNKNIYADIGGSGITAGDCHKSKRGIGYRYESGETMIGIQASDKVDDISGVISWKF